MLQQLPSLRQFKLPQYVDTSQINDVLQVRRLKKTKCPHVQSSGDLPSLGGRQLLEVLQGRRHIEQLLVENQGEVEVHHCGVVDGQTADDPDQVEPVLLNKTLERHKRK